LPLLERVLEVLFSKRNENILWFPLDLLHSVKAATLSLVAASSLGTRDGSTGMIPRLNNILHNGRAQDPQDRRQGRSAAWPRACSSCFSTFKWLCTFNLPPKARPWMLSSTAMFFAVWGRTFGENDLKCGSGEMTVPWWQCTCSPSSRNAWVSRPQQHYHTSASALLTRFGPLRLLPLPQRWSWS
jgi:hypothetical protein